MEIKWKGIIYIFHKISLNYMAYLAYINYRIVWKIWVDLLINKSIHILSHGSWLDFNAFIILTWSLWGGKLLGHDGHYVHAD